MGEMTKNQKKEALRAWRQKEKKSYCLEKEEVEELFEYLEEALEEEECDNSLKNTEQWIIDNIDDEERRDQVRREIKEDIVTVKYWVIATRSMIFKCIKKVHRGK